MTVQRTVGAEPLMGTVVSVDIRGRTGSEVDVAVAAFLDELRELERVFSPWLPDSEISRISDGRLAIAEASPDVRFVLSACDHLHAISAGAFDARGHRADNRLDPSGFVKGWAVEEAARHLDAAGLLDYGVNAGGDILVRGDAEPGSGGGWRIGVRDPDRGDAVVRTLNVRGLAVATSGLYERGAHIRSPRGRGADRGAPTSPLTSLTVVGPSLGWADAYATAGFVMGAGGLDWVDGLDGYGALAMHADRLMTWTASLDPLVMPAAGVEAGQPSAFSRSSHQPDVSWST